MLVVRRLDGRSVPRHEGVALIDRPKVRRVALNASRESRWDHHANGRDQAVRRVAPTAQDVVVPVDEALCEAEHGDLDHILQVIERLARRVVGGEGDVDGLLGNDVGVRVRVGKHVFGTVLDDEQGLLGSVRANQVRARRSARVGIEASIEPCRPVHVVVPLVVHAVYASDTEVRGQLDALHRLVDVRGAGVHVGVETTLIPSVAAIPLAVIKARRSAGHDLEDKAAARTAHDVSRSIAAVLDVREQVVDAEVGTTRAHTVAREHRDVLPTEARHVLGGHLVDVRCREQARTVHRGDAVIVQGRDLVARCPTKRKAHQKLLEGAEHDRLGTKVNEQFRLATDLKVVATGAVVRSERRVESEARETVPCHQGLAVEVVFVLGGTRAGPNVEGVRVLVLGSLTKQGRRCRVHHREPRQGVRKTRHATTARAIQDARVERHVTGDGSGTQAIPRV